ISHCWSFSIFIFIVLQNGIGDFFSLKILYISQFFFDFIPLKNPCSVFIRIGVFKDIFIESKFFFQNDVFLRSRATYFYLFSLFCFNNRILSLGVYQRLINGFVLTRKKYSGK